MMISLENIRRDFQMRESKNATSEKNLTLRILAGRFMLPNILSMQDALKIL